MIIVLLRQDLSINFQFNFVPLTFPLFIYTMSLAGLPPAFSTGSSVPPIRCPSFFWIYPHFVGHPSCILPVLSLVLLLRFVRFPSMLLLLSLGLAVPLSGPLTPVCCPSSLYPMPLTCQLPLYAVHLCLCPYLSSVLSTSPFS